MLAKGRKVAAGGRGGETMAANYAFGASEVEESIIKHRLLTRTTTTRGDPPLKKLQKKFTSLFAEIDADRDNSGDCERLARAFLQELSTFEIPLLKTRAVVDAHLREKDNFCDLHNEINAQIARARSDIDALKAQLQESRIERRHKEECEAVRKLISAQPPRSETQSLISRLESEIASLDADNSASARLLDLRKKQFALLLHVVDELQSTIEDEQMRLAAEDHKSALEDGDAMAVD